MKRLLSIISAVSLLACSAVSCGNSDADGSSSSVSSSAAGRTPGEELYRDLLTDMVYLARDGSAKGVMDLTMPDSFLTALENTGAMEMMTGSIEDTLSDFASIDVDELQFVSSRECDEQIISDLEKIYSAYANMFIFFEERGIRMDDDLEESDLSDDDIEQLLTYIDQFDSIKDVDYRDVDISVALYDAQYVTFANGSGIEKNFVFYKAEGSDWKVDTLGYTLLNY